MMLEAKGKCKNCQCSLLLSRELGWSSLSRVCPVCGCEKLEWVEPKEGIESGADEEREELVEGMGELAKTIGHRRLPSTGILFRLILDHLGLEVDDEADVWRLKKK